MLSTHVWRSTLRLVFFVKVTSLQGCHPHLLFLSDPDHIQYADTDPGGLNGKQNNCKEIACNWKIIIINPFPLSV